jgi:hypothetical protein
MWIESLGNTKKYSILQLDEVQMIVRNRALSEVEMRLMYLKYPKYAVNYSISGLELIALLPLPPAPLHFERLVIFLFGSPL